MHRRHGWAWLLAGAAVGAADLYVCARYGAVPAVSYVSDVLFAVTWVVVSGILAMNLRPNSRIGVDPSFIETSLEVFRPIDGGVEVLDRARV